jgi:hypothetical protein
MKDRGSLIGSVLNVRSCGNLKSLLIDKDWEYKESGILDEDHVRFFTERSLRRFLTSHGLVIDLFRGINKCRIPEFSVKNLIGGVLINAAIGITLGFYSDIRYLQFGFRAYKSKRK